MTMTEGEQRTAHKEHKQEPRPFDFLKSKITSNLTMRGCMPVLDFMTCGYYLPMWVEILFFKNEQNGLGYYTEINTRKVLDNHAPTQFSTLFRTQHLFKELYGYFDKSNYDKLALYKFINPWVIKTPPGYSCMFIPPLYQDQKIKILPAVVDTDTYKGRINFPFSINLDLNEEYNTKLGEPFIQVIPFKRVDYKMDVTLNEEGDDGDHDILLMAALRNAYKRFYRKIKRYE